MAKNLVVRLDDRLIHGQVCTQWLGALHSNRIVVIDDQVAQDDFQRSVLEFAAPPNIALDILTVDEAVQRWNEDQFGNESVFVLFKTVEQIEKAVSSGFEIKALTIGQTAITGERKLVHRQVGFNEDEAIILTRLAHEGMEINFQMIPNDKKVPLDQKISKVFPNI